MKVNVVHHVSYELRAPSPPSSASRSLSDPFDRPADGKAGRISRLRHQIDQRAARAHRRSRSRHHRCRRHEAGARPGQYRKGHRGRPPKAFRTGWRPTASNSRSTSIPISAKLTGNERRVVQVLYNLLANAVGFARCGSSQRAAVRAPRHLHRRRCRAPRPRERQGVRLVREPFPQAPRHRGAGLGLSLVSSSCAAAGCASNSAVGKGTTVTCDFPVDQNAHPQRRRMNAPATLVALANEEATAHSLMADLALLIGPGDVITLSGDLGAGKTAAARAMIRSTNNSVPSPTFTLAQSYELPFPIVHADLYRINNSTNWRKSDCRRCRGHPGADRMAGARAGRASEDRIDIASATAQNSDPPPAPPKSPATARPPRRWSDWAACENFSNSGFGDIARRRRLDAFLCAADPTTARQS